MCRENRPRQFPVTRLSGYKIAAPMSQFGHESHMGAGRRTFTYEGLVLDMEVACRRQNTFTSPVSREHSVFVVASSTLLVSTPPKHAHWTLVLCSNGHHLGTGRVESLEAKTLGERLGYRRKPYVFRDVFSPIHSSRATHVEPWLGDVVYRNDRPFFFRVARKTGRPFPFWVR
jgi:hypothetical protein